MSPLEKAARAVRDTLFLVKQPGREVTHEHVARAVLLAVRDEVVEGYDDAEHYAFVGMIDAILEGE